MKTTDWLRRPTTPAIAAVAFSIVLLAGLAPMTPAWGELEHRLIHLKLGPEWLWPTAFVAVIVIIVLACASSVLGLVFSAKLLINRHVASRLEHWEYRRPYNIKARRAANLTGIMWICTAACYALSLLLLATVTHLA
jgi:hypothetical protein